MKSLELLERLRPVILEQPRQPAIGEQLAAGLAGRAVVGFVGRVLNALNRRAAHRTRLAVASVRGHAVAKRRDLLGKFLAGLGDQLVAPLREDADRVRVQAFDLFRRQLAGQQHRRHLRGVQDLVRIGVADAAQQVRIGQRALQRVILARQRRAELPRRSTVSTSRPPGSCDASSFSPRTRYSDARRFDPASVRISEPLSKVECGETDLAGNLWMLRSAPSAPVCGPLEAAGDHQVDDEEQLVFELHTSRLPRRRSADDLLAVGVIDRRIERANEERAGEADPIEPLPDDARSQRMQVELDVRKFRHAVICV